MFIIILLIIYIIYITYNLILYFLVKKYGEFSYDGLTLAGFKYDIKEDAFVPTKNSWQRHFGYGYIYDVLAPLVNIIIDTESIYFEHDGYNYLVSFWKGQYGVSLGAEIGVYKTKNKHVNKRTIYQRSDDDIKMSFVLYKNGERIVEASDYYWWVAAFKLGEFSYPKNLTMDIWITFPNGEFLNSFLDGLKKLDYKDYEYKVIGSTFIFRFVKPKTGVVFTRTKLREYIALKQNRIRAKIIKNNIDSYVEKNGVDDTYTGKYILLSNLINPLMGDKTHES